MTRDELIDKLWTTGVPKEVLAHVLDALDALNQGPKRVAELERELAEAESALWRVFPNSHSVGKKLPDPFEGPDETYRAAHERMEKRLAELEGRINAACDAAEDFYIRPQGSLWNYGTAPSSLDKVKWQATEDTALQLLWHLDHGRARSLAETRAALKGQDNG